MFKIKPFQFNQGNTQAAQKAPLSLLKMRPDMSLFSGLIQKLSFAKKTQHFYMEMTDDWLKLAGTSGSDRKNQKLVCADAVPISGMNEIQKSEKILQFLKSNLFKPDRTVILHSSQNLTTRILTLPSTEMNEIRDIISLQAVKQTPYSKDEICTGFKVIEMDKTGYSRVFVAITHRDVASGYYRTGELSGLSADAVAVAVEGVQSWYEAAKTVTDGETCLLLDMDWASTEVLVMRGTKMVYNRSISLGVKHLEELGGGGLTSFLPELQRSLEAGHEELKGTAVAKIVLTGMGGKLQELVPVLSREFSIPCEILPNARPFQERISDLILAKMQKFTCSFAALFGFAFNAPGVPINLIPPQIEARKSLEDRAKDLAILGSLLLALVTLISAISFEKIYKKDQYLKYLQSEYEKVQAPAENVQRVAAKMKLAGEQMNIGGNFLDVIYDITEVLPPSMYLTSIQYNASESWIVVRGISEEMSAVFKLLSTMEAAPHLEFVKTRNVTKRKVGEKDAAEFEIYAQIVGGNGNRSGSPPASANAAEASAQGQQGNDPGSNTNAVIEVANDAAPQDQIK